MKITRLQRQILRFLSTDLDSMKVCILDKTYITSQTLQLVGHLKWVD